MYLASNPVGLLRPSLLCVDGHAIFFREETVSLLLHHMFDGELVESVIVNGISVLLALLEIRRPAPFG